MPWGISIFSRVNETWFTISTGSNAVIYLIHSKNTTKLSCPETTVHFLRALSNTVVQLLLSAAL